MFPEHKYRPPSPGHMGFVVDKVALERILLPILLEVSTVV
jgi:hypothetical protein